MAITKEKFNKVANELSEKGMKVTQKNIRAKLGGGSISTINPLLQEWKKEQDKSGELLKLELPEELISKGDLLVRNFWTTCMGEAEQRIQLERELLSKAKLEMQEDIKGIMEVVEELESEVNQKEEILIVTKKKLLESIEKEKQMEKNLISSEAALSEEIKGLKSRLSDAHKANQEISNLKKVISDMSD